MPVTRRMAKNSDDAWKDRFALQADGLMLRTNPIHHSIGLRQLLYIGSAYRWPHKHTAWSARLERSGLNPLYLQVIALPQRALQNAKRILPSAIPVEWTAFNYNIDQFQQKTGSWSFSVESILDSLNSSKSENSLRRTFDVRKTERIYDLSRSESRILGSASMGFLLEFMESESYAKALGVTNEELAKSIERMRDNRVLSIHYFGGFRGLYSMLLDLQGKEPQVMAFVDALAKEATSYTIFKSEENARFIIVARLPRIAVPELKAKLPQSAEEHDLGIRLYPITAYSAYRSSLYDRLLLEDGTWDSDISGLASQSSSSSS
jgi:hypothetical protein